MIRLPAHWIHRSKYLINTCPNQRLRAAFLLWLSSDISGAYIWGEPRIGKSHQVQGLGSHIVTDTGESVPIFLAQYQEGRIESIKAFWAYLLFTLQIAFDPGQQAYVLYGNLVDALKAAASCNAGRRVVLVIDEAQELKKAHYRRLKALANELALQGYRLLLVSLGSNEMPEKIKAFNAKNDSALTKRFFLSYHHMFGLRGRVELEHALKWYDTPRPAYGSAAGYTADFLPISYSKGFRLASLADVMWRRFVSACPTHSESGFHMQFFCVAVNELLTRLITDGAEVTVAQIDMAITKSGLLGAIDDAVPTLEMYEAA